MCGIVGRVGNPGRQDLHQIIEAMTGTLVHRGPDASDVWVNVAEGVALGHRRLAVLELTDAGAQPMVSAGGQFVLVFNGEIYNHLELRRALEREGRAPPWRGHSDTETLLACFEAWGVQRSLRSAVGMFALAAWNQTTRILTLARDRMGEKPLYYGMSNGTVFFGSEIHALRPAPEFSNEIDRHALTAFLRFGYYPAPLSAIAGVRKVRAGSSISFGPASAGGFQQVEEVDYWQAWGEVRPAWDGGDTRAAVDELERLLCAAVRGQMVADVPVGAFLSGGVDSSVITAIMQIESSRAVKTFTIGFTDPAYDEAEHAAAIARHLGTDHTAIYVTDAEARDVIPLLPSIYSEPLGDSSQIPTFLLSRLARQTVTVALSGDGGDELFGGYNTYRRAAQFWNIVHHVPLPARRVLGGWLQGAAGLGGRGRIAIAAQLAGAPGREELYRQWISHWREPEEVVLDGHEPASLHHLAGGWAAGAEFREWMMAIEAQTYLPDDVLVKVDRAAMAVSLETRVPLLDHRLVEFALALPIHLKIRGNRGKWLLRQVLNRHVPQSLFDRPKKGFSIPLAAWLRGPLRDWGEDLLSPERLRLEGYFNPGPVRRAWAQHLQGRSDRSRALWPILMFQSWLRQQPDIAGEFRRSGYG